METAPLMPLGFLKLPPFCPFFFPKLPHSCPLDENTAFIKGEMFRYYMAKRRKKAQRFTRQVRASIKVFLRSIEFAPMGEILAYVGADDTLEGLSGQERRAVAFTVMKAPVFHSFKTVNAVKHTYHKRPQTLWRVNEDYEEFVPLKKD